MPSEPLITSPPRRYGVLGWSLAALLLGSLLSLLLSREHARLLQQQQDAELERTAERVVEGMRQQLETGGVLIRAMQTAFVLLGDVDQPRFEAIYDNLRAKASFPGLIATGYSRRVRDPEGGNRYPTERVAPLAGNEAVLGLDVNSQPSNHSALEQSRDSNEPTLSASFRLVQRAGRSEPVDGITLRLPVFRGGVAPTAIAQRRENFVGSLAVSFRVSELIANALPDTTAAGIEVRVSDVSQGFGQVLYQTEAALAWTSAANTPVVHTRDLSYGSRTWRVEVARADGAGDGVDWIPWATFAGGVLASLLLALWLLELGRTRERALGLAGRLSAQYRDSEARFRALNELLPIAVVLADARDGRIVHVNQSGRELLGFSAGNTQSHRLEQLFEDPQLGAQLAGAEGAVPPGALVTRMLSPLHGAFWASIAISHVELDAADHVLAVISDVTEFRELTDRLGYQASHDALTDLYNRREFERRLELATQRDDAVRGSGALLYLDLDQFKLINDTSGHIAGDQLLAALGLVLKQSIGPDDVLARLGGDEFGILLDSVTSERALALADQLRQRVDDFSFAWELKRYALTVSIGIVMIEPRSGRSLRELLSLADTACYMAKERGRNRVHLFSEHDLETTQRRGEMEWASRLRQALEENRFTLYYQEIEALRPCAAGGAHFELLLRLRDEQGALVPPGAFVPAAERYNLMPQLDRWVLRTALANFDRLHPQRGAVGLCSINLSGNTLEDESFPDFVVEQLRHYAVAAERICFEITETAAVGNMARVVHFIQRLRALGCRFALDDFGVGMSSFGYLKNLPVDFIKIDGSFIREIETDPMSLSIVRAVTDIGHQVGVEVVAEFVGNSRTRELLRDLGVDYAQGYAIHVPAPAGVG